MGMQSDREEVQHFILNYNRSYQRYFLGKYPLEIQFSIITGLKRLYIGQPTGRRPLTYYKSFLSSIEPQVLPF